MDSVSVQPIWYHLVQGVLPILLLIKDNSYRCSGFELLVHREENITKVVNLLDGGEVTLRVEDLTDGEEWLVLASPSRELDSLDLILSEAVCLVVGLDLLVPLLLRHAIARINDKVILPLDIGTLLLGIIEEDSVEVQFQTHELCQ